MNFTSSAQLSLATSRAILTSRNSPAAQPVIVRALVMSCVCPAVPGTAAAVAVSVTPAVSHASLAARLNVVMSQPTVPAVAAGWRDQMRMLAAVNTAVDGSANIQDADSEVVGSKSSV